MKLYELEFIMKCYNLDIVMIQETKSDRIYIDGYYSIIIPSVKNKIRTRGLVILIKKRYSYTIRKLDDICSPNIAAVELSFMTYRIILLNIYIHKKEYKSMFSKLYDISKIYDKMIIVGDFNVSRRDNRFSMLNKFMNEREFRIIDYSNSRMNILIIY